MRRFSQLLLLSLLMALAPCVALSQNKKEDDPEEIQKQRDAQKHFEEAEKLYNIGDFNSALEGYKKSYLLSANPDLLFNMGQCYRKLEDYDLAITTYRSYLREVPNSPVKADVEKLITDVEALRATRQFSKLVIASNPIGAEVRKGGVTSRVLGVTPYTDEKLPPGEYHFTLTLPGYKPYEFDITAVGGKDYFIPEVKLSSTANVKPQWAYRLSVAAAPYASSAFGFGGGALASLERFSPSYKSSYGIIFTSIKAAETFNMLGGTFSKWRPLKRPLWSLSYGGAIGDLLAGSINTLYLHGQVLLHREGEYRGALYLRPLELGVALGGVKPTLELGLFGLGYTWGLRKRATPPE
jgi:tetratricopeptide (TPR) repeat protein